MMTKYFSISILFSILLLLSSLGYSRPQTNDIVTNTENGDDITIPPLKSVDTNIQEDLELSDNSVDEDGVDEVNTLVTEVPADVESEYFENVTLETVTVAEDLDTEVDATTAEPEAQTQTVNEADETVDSVTDGSPEVESQPENNVDPEIVDPTEAADDEVGDTTDVDGNDDVGVEVTETPETVEQPSVNDDETVEVEQPELPQEEPTTLDEPETIDQGIITENSDVNVVSETATDTAPLPQPEIENPEESIEPTEDNLTIKPEGTIPLSDRERARSHGFKVAVTKRISVKEHGFIPNGILAEDIDSDKMTISINNQTGNYHIHIEIPKENLDDNEGKDDDFITNYSDFEDPDNDQDIEVPSMEEVDEIETVEQAVDPIEEPGSPGNDTSVVVIPGDTGDEPMGSPDDTGTSEVDRNATEHPPVIPEPTEPSNVDEPIKTQAPTQLPSPQESDADVVIVEEESTSWFVNTDGSWNWIGIILLFFFLVI